MNNPEPGHITHHQLEIPQWSADSKDENIFKKKTSLVEEQGTKVVKSRDLQESNKT